MSWIYLALDHSTCSLDTAESRSRSNHTQDQSPIVSKTDFVRPYSCLECGAINFRELPFGTTCEHCGGIFCLGLTSSAADSPARTLALRDAELAWSESEADFSSRLSDLQKKLERRFCSLKTSPQLELADLERSSEHLPRWAMTVAGRVFLPQALEPRTSETAGSYLPTPTASRSGRNKSASQGAAIRPSLDTMARKNLWPTPRANDGEKRGDFDANNPRNGLPAAVKREQFPTPRASEALRGHGGGANRKEHQKTLSQKIGGQLNPTWVEWLMGFPSGWTDLNN